MSDDVILTAEEYRALVEKRYLENAGKLNARFEALQELVAEVLELPSSWHLRSDDPIYDGLFKLHAEIERLQSERALAVRVASALDWLMHKGLDVPVGQFYADAMFSVGDATVITTTKDKQPVTAGDIKRVLSWYREDANNG